MTNHSHDIGELRKYVDTREGFQSTNLHDMASLLAADLLEQHDYLQISLDDWPAARALVEEMIGHQITKNNKDINQSKLEELTKKWNRNPSSWTEEDKEEFTKAWIKVNLPTRLEDVPQP